MVQSESTKPAAGRLIRSLKKKQIKKWWTFSLACATHALRCALHSALQQDESLQTPLVCYFQLHRFIPSTARELGQDSSRCPLTV